VLGRSVHGLDFGSVDGRPTQFVFGLVAPSDSAGEYLKALARVSHLFRDAGFRQRLLAAADAAAMYRAIVAEDAKY
jgi:nitrogen PTS system EIIA component